VEYVARVEHCIAAHKFWWGDLREEDHLKDLEADGKILLK
jgi:hypothetical protein